MNNELTEIDWSKVSDDEIQLDPELEIGTGLDPELNSRLKDMWCDMIFTMEAERHAAEKEGRKYVPISELRTDNRKNV